MPVRDIGHAFHEKTAHRYVTDSTLPAMQTDGPNRKRFSVNHKLNIQLGKKRFIQRTASNTRKIGNYTQIERKCIYRQRAYFESKHFKMPTIT